MVQTELMAAHVPGRLRAGEVIGDRYRVVKWLAEGGMGEVYLAEHVALGKPFALKVMLPELSVDDEFVERFKREAIAASRIGHKNIVNVSDFGSTPNGRLYLAMEFLEGRTLAALIAEGAVAPARVLHLGLQVAGALAAAHRLGIFHRDVKPENVIVLQRPDQPDVAKVVDFGAAKDSARSGQTALGMVMGTPSHMSPEQAVGLPVDARTDVYALGLVLYELLVGPRGLPAPDLQTELPPLPAIAGLAPELGALVEQMVKKRSHQRPASMDEVVTRLEAVGQRTVVSVAHQGPVPSAGFDQSTTANQKNAWVSQLGQRTEVELPARPRRRWLWPGLAIVALGVAIALARWLLLQRA